MTLGSISTRTERARVFTTTPLMLYESLATSLCLRKKLSLSSPPFSSVCSSAIVRSKEDPSWIPHWPTCRDTTLEVILSTRAFVFFLLLRLLLLQTPVPSLQVQQDTILVSGLAFLSLPSHLQTFHILPGFVFTDKTSALDLKNKGALPSSSLVIC